MTQCYIGTAAIASHLSVSTQTVRDWLRSGRLVGSQLPGPKRSRWRVRIEDWERFLMSWRGR